tara:strand:+ start:56 stop:229 length:174 start_codon:yes stop_codon:yes gene_type:complete
MHKSKQQRRQLLEFSQWVAVEENEELMLGVTVPHDPPNAEENKQPNGLKIDNYGRFK